MVDLNPLHYVNKFNHMMGDSLASGLEFLGITDPAVDPDGIREIAKKWRHLATGLDDAAEAARKAMADVEWEGKAAKAFHKRSKAARKQATEMADALREGAKALDDFADQAHELLTEMGVLVAEIAEFEIAGLALSVLTGGASAVVSSLMAGSRAVKVVALVARIEKEGTVLASAIRGVLEVIRAVERALKALKEIRGVAAAARMAKGGAEFAAFDAMLKDPAAFTDPEKLAGILTEGALLGVGFGMLGKVLGKGLKALKPADLAKLGKGLGLDCAAFERLRLNPGFDKLPASIRNMVKKFVRDPIDVATGDMALPRVDVSLPGVLPLILERTHLSSYRWGGWFGPSWASTIDQRVQADEDGFVYAAADGSRLCFPLLNPESNEPVRPQTPGSRLLLSWDDDTDGAVRITDPGTGLTHVFHSPVPAAEDTAIDLPLQHVQDRNGNRITVTYTEGDIPDQVVHSGGYRIALDHDRARSRVTGLRLLDPAHPDAPGTTLLTFGYDESGHLIEETNSSGLPMRYTYDPEGRVTSWTDRNDTTYWYAYDDRGRVTATGGTADALASTLAYDDPTRTTRVTDSLGHTRIYEHNEDLRLISETDPLGNVTRQEWDDEHRLVAIRDQLGNATGFRYDEQGNRTALVRPDGRETTTRYNCLGLAEELADPDGLLWQQTYDARGNRTTVTDRAGATTRFAWSSRGVLTSVTDALGQTTAVVSDARGLPAQIIDPLGSATRYERDAFGRCVAVTDPGGGTTRLEWTVEGMLARRVAADGTVESWTYDGEGNCTSHTDPAGAITRSEYTYFDLPAVRTGPDGTRHSYTHDTEGRLVQVTNPQNMRWSYAYDAAGRLVSETDFDGRTLTYDRNAAGLLVARTDALGRTTRYTHDVLSRVVRKQVDEEVTTYAYAPNGLLTDAVSPDVSLNRRYDLRGNLTAETVDGRTTTYEYDILGRRTRRTTPTGATTVTAYDSADNVVELATSGPTVGFGRIDGSSRELALTIGANTTVTRAFDAQGRVLHRSVTGRGGHQVQRRDYLYHPGGSLAGYDEQVNGGRRFELDEAGRVTAVEAADWSERYTYDEVGNQTTASWPASHPGQEATGSRSYSGTRITRAGRVRYKHDALGRVTLRQKTRPSSKPDTWRYTWGAEDRLVSAVTPDGTVWRYRYDALGRRTAKQRFSVDGLTVVEQVDFTWDGSTLCEQTALSDGARQQVTLTWDHQGTRPITQTERITAADAPQEEIDSRFFAVVTDLVGTPTELLDEDGDIAWRARSTLWGTTVWAADSTAYTPLRFPGQYFDPETGLHYNYFRHYDPETARYVTPDPLGLAPAPNPAAYVHNPLTWVDHLGLAPRCEESFPIYRTPKGKDAAYELENGPNPANHQPGIDIGYGELSDGLMYFGERDVAATYMSPTGRNFADGMVRYDMHPDFLKEFAQHPYMRRYDLQGPGGAPRIEFAIPVDKLGRFSELTLKRTWIPFNGSG
ncbi:RHS repeat-associated core domain-containing protein [Streptomyces sp. NPDC090106]|uniref:RHS repeat-associated core domain-containing protein n=1 Tax=Streptomyces sp. NPDC090106 TaxID=3365946 RepID=UPI003827FCA3